MKQKLLFTAIVTLFFLTINTQAGIIDGPYLQNVTPNSINVSILTTKKTSSRVEYGLTTAYGNQVIVNWPQSEFTGEDDYYSYRFNITGLSANTVYHYRIVNDSYYSDHTFRTAKTGTSCKIAVYGDTQNTYYHNLVATSIDYQSPDFVLHVGDLSNDGTDIEQWNDVFFAPANDDYLSHIPFFSVCGNHDVNGFNDIYRKLVTLPENSDTPERYYSFEYANALIIGLDSFLGLTDTSPQYLWLADKLANNTQTWTIIFCHVPPISATDLNKRDDNFRNYVIPLLENYDVDMVFSGHVHNYEHNLKDGIHYIITGGGGDVVSSYTIFDNTYLVNVDNQSHHCLLDISGYELVCKAINTSNQIMEQFTINKSSIPEPEIVISPSTLNYGSVDSVKTFNVSNPGDATLTWQASESTSWITSISPANASINPGNNTNITVTISRTGLAYDNYSSNISITSNAGNETIPVYMTKPAPSAPPDLYVSVGSINFDSTQSQSDFYLQNIGGGTLYWQITESISWLSLNQTSGNLSENQSVNLTAYVDRDGLNSGNYNGTIYITSDGGNETIAIAMTVPVQTESEPIYVCRMNCGDEDNDYTDGDGNFWEKDKKFSWVYNRGYVDNPETSEKSTLHSIGNTTNDVIYQKNRFDVFEYKFDNISSSPGDYRVILHFAEIYYNDVWCSRQAISIEGTTVISLLDIYASYSHDNAVTFQFDTYVDDGCLNINFAKVNNKNTQISAIEVLGYPAGTLLKNRIIDYDRLEFNDGIILPKKFALSCYPNPFNSSTIIQYVLPEWGDVNLSVYNALGQQVRQLQLQVPAGSYRWNLDFNDLSAGVYFCRANVRFENKLDSINLKMFLVR